MKKLKNRVLDVNNEFRFNVRFVGENMDLGSGLNLAQFWT